jgi:hypothetical protein
MVPVVWAITGVDATTVITVTMAATRKLSSIPATPTSYNRLVQKRFCRRQIKKLLKAPNGNHGRPSALNVIRAVGRERIKADMIAGPAWPLEGRAFSAATSTACAGS